MAGYKINQAQRDVLDRIVLEALRPEMSTIADIVDRVKAAMVATRERWAITYSRDATFESQVGNALRRWRDKGRVERGANPRVSEWRLASTPSRMEMIDAILAEIDDWDLETLIDHARERVRADLSKQTDDEIAAQWREASE